MLTHFNNFCNEYDTKYSYLVAYYFNSILLMTSREKVHVADWSHDVTDQQSVAAGFSNNLSACVISEHAEPRVSQFSAAGENRHRDSCARTCERVPTQLLGTEGCRCPETLVQWRVQWVCARRCTAGWSCECRLGLPAPCRMLPPHPKSDQQTSTSTESY